MGQLQEKGERLEVDARGRDHPRRGERPGGCGIGCRAGPCNAQVLGKPRQRRVSGEVLEQTQSDSRGASRVRGAPV